MLVVRNAVPQDLDAIHALAQGAGPGMTTFKPDRAALAQRLSVAAASFGAGLPRAQADYLFVLEDLAVGRVCGVAAIKAAVGVAEPFYNYRISTSVHANEAAGRVHHAQSLHLTHDLSGASELCSLYLHPDYRKGANGRLLSKARLLFVAQFADLFAPTIFAEMRGVQDALGRSPFWESVGRPFFQMDFHEADDLCGQGDRLFIEQLVPRLPLYTHLLTDAARAAIGQTHADTAPARRLLEQEGLHFDGYVDIFDGGPVLQAKVRDLRALRASRLRIVQDGAAVGTTPSLVATTARQRFRAVVAAVDAQVADVYADSQADLQADLQANTQTNPQAARLHLPQAARDALDCDPGAVVRVLALAAR